LRLVSLLTTVVLTSGIGLFVAETSYKNAINKIDHNISSTIEDAQSSSNQELSAALLHIEEYSLDVALYLYSRDGTSTLVNEATTTFEPLDLTQVRRAVNKVVSSKSGVDFRYRSLSISGGDFLVVAASQSIAGKDLKSNLISVLLVTIFTSLATFFLLSIYIGRLKNRDEAEALARMQSFLGDASHELRTPLTVIKGYVEMLSKGQMTEPADRIRAFTRVSTEIVRMESLIHDLLLLAELGESAHRDNEEIDLSELVTSHAEDFKTLNQLRKVEVLVTPEIMIDGVRDYHARFIQNALNNISRHTEADVPVKVSLKQDGKEATLIIEDGGKGLPESAYMQSVKSLTRFDPSRSRESGGSGLGMSIMAAVVAKSSGTLTLRKSELGGLAVVAVLPTSRG
jgi:K+-sensing histidine kinase KdpD